MDALKLCYKVLSWNVRGLNSREKQEEVRQVVSLMQPDLICLQETKLEALTPASILGQIMNTTSSLRHPKGLEGGSFLHPRSQDSIYSLLSVLLMPSHKNSLIAQTMLYRPLLVCMALKMILIRRSS
jgi:endonuclease/exonuclease/phosphatase family metal-dependent hydrolase